jgi:hypothetical protein
MPMAKTGRNELCPCGSGKKFKRCHEIKQQGGGVSARMTLIVVAGAMIAALLLGIATFTGGGSSAGVRIWSPEHGHYHDANGVQVP